MTPCRWGHSPRPSAPATGRSGLTPEQPLSSIISDKKEGAEIYQELAHMIPLSVTWPGRCGCPHFIDEETEAQVWAGE